MYFKYIKKPLKTKQYRKNKNCIIYKIICCVIIVYCNFNTTFAQTSYK